MLCYANGLYWFLLVCTGIYQPQQVCITSLCLLLSTDLHHLLEGVQVFLHAVVEPQVGDEVAGKHPIKTVEQGVDTSVEVDQVDHRDLTWRRQPAGKWVEAKCLLTL